jgi:hypothetical protein
MASMAAEGREPLRDWISLSVSLLFRVPVSGRKPFLIFPEIRNSDRAEILTQFFPDIIFLAAKEGVQLTYEAPTSHNGAPHLPGRALVACGHLGYRLALILLPKNHIYSKINLCKFLSRLDFV